MTFNTREENHKLSHDNRRWFLQQSASVCPSDEINYRLQLGALNKAYLLYHQDAAMQHRGIRALLNLSTMLYMTVVLPAFCWLSSVPSIYWLGTKALHSNR